MSRPAGPAHLGDLSHLSPEDAELYAALYAERNRVDVIVDPRANTGSVATNPLRCSYSEPTRGREHAA